jgi:hypothetical protein
MKRVIGYAARKLNNAGSKGLGFDASPRLGKCDQTFPRRSASSAWKRAGVVESLVDLRAVALQTVHANARGFRTAVADQCVAI